MTNKYVGQEHKTEEKTTTLKKSNRTRSPKSVKKILSNMLRCFLCCNIRTRKGSKSSDYKRKISKNGYNNGEMTRREFSSVDSYEISLRNFKTSNLGVAKKYAEDILGKCDLTSNISNDNITYSDISSNYHKTVTWEIPQDKIEINEFVGKGTYGTVHKCEYYGKAALKKINVSDPSEEDLKSFRNEISVLQQLRHEYILLFIGCIVNPYLAIVTEWCDGSSLYKELHVKQVVFKPLTVLYIARQFAEGMTYLYTKSIIHCDLKSNNVFLTHIGVIKIGDFGLATLKTMIKTKRNPKLVGSVYWMAPEIIRQRKYCGHSSDVYAFGIVLYELTMGCFPHSELDHPHQILFKVGTSKAPLNLDGMRSDLPSSLEDLVHKCCHYDYELRPTFDVVLQEILNMISNSPRFNRSLSDSHLL